MKRTNLMIIAALLAAIAMVPGHAHARVYVGIGVGGCCYGGYYGGYPYYPAYYAPYYAPPVVYAAPPPVAVSYAVPATPANQTSATYVDGLGRTCRQYQSTTNGAVGSACLMSDGTWRTVQ